MSEFQYCYWLMGIFELGNVKQLNPKQLLLIKEHLNLVENREYFFCNWLEGVLDMNELENMSEKNTMIILNTLRKEFYNVIDVSYPKELWNNLTLAHEGKY